MESRISLPRRKLLGIISIEYKLVNKTGLLIRSPIAKAGIGGADAQPMLTKKKYKIRLDNSTIEKELEIPYIPGSSIKGRMRCLLELYEGAILRFDGKIHMHVRDLNSRKPGTCQNLDHALDNLFGSPSIQAMNLDDKLLKEVQEKIAPTRLIVEDVFPSVEYVEKLYRRYGTVGKDEFLEEKSENRIDRITSAADPRFILRVRPDVEFAGRMTLLLFDVDYRDGKIKEYLDLLFAGMKLIEDTYLGGSGSRGYGKVIFKDISITLKTPDYYVSSNGKVTVVEKAANVDELLRMKDEIIAKINTEIAKYVK